MKDKQGNEIVINSAYKYVFGMPGPDITVLIVKSKKENGVCHCYDINFKFSLDVESEKLFKPLKYGFSA